LRKLWHGIGQHAGGQATADLISKRPRLARGIGIAVLLFTAVLPAVASDSVVLELFVRLAASAYYYIG
jgi:hypothetical protein